MSEGTMLDIVISETAAVIKPGSSLDGDIWPERSFTSLGLYGNAAEELRRRLEVLVGTPLPESLTRDYPTLISLSTHLWEISSADHKPVSLVRLHGLGSPALPIAITGMACRLPGGVQSPDDLWHLVSNGKNVISAAPEDRGWNDHAGPVLGGFIESASEFDCEFFGISPREALAMDPQQRLLLETSWEALERSGIVPSSLRGSSTGVFIGTWAQDYGCPSQGDSAALEGYRLTGTWPGVASGRIAYTLGLEGPAITVDTACSSSLVALHLAMQSLRSGECNMALVGGAAVMATPEIFAEFQRLRGLAADGRCKAFSAAADGTYWAEGVSMLLLERLSDAQRMNRPVLALVRGSAVNQDGASDGLTVPNLQSQKRMILQALANSRLTTGDVDVVEAHGTGTRKGDAIEAEAILSTYGQGRGNSLPLLIGSLKSNIGHAQAAAGISGVIKTVLAMRHGIVPKTLHVEEPTPRVDWSSGSVQLATENFPWPNNGGPRRAGVSSFGAGGTNAHVILEQSPDDRIEGDFKSATESADAFFPISAKTEEALRGQADRLIAHLDRNPSLRIHDIAFSLIAKRTHFRHRAAVVGSDRESLISGLRTVAKGRISGTVSSGAALHGMKPKTAFIFPGQGSQWVGMGRDLLSSSPVFAKEMAACEESLVPHVGWSVTGVLRGECGSPSLENDDVVQPVLWAVMVSLAGLWRSYGVHPDAVIGHSQGEIAAAVVAGALSLEDGARLVAARSRILCKLPGVGGMLSVSLPKESAEREIAKYPGVYMAVINSPNSVVVSGEATALKDFQIHLEEEGIQPRRIAVRYASHSPQVEAIKHDLLAEIYSVSARKSSIPFYSTVTGGLLDTAALGPEYWYANIRNTVHFSGAVQKMIADGYDALIECSPNPVLAVPLSQIAESSAGRFDVICSLRRRAPERLSILSSLGKLWTLGIEIDLGAYITESPAQAADLPTYAFQRKQFWFKSSTGPAVASHKTHLPAETPHQSDFGIAPKEPKIPLDYGELFQEISREAADILGYGSADDIPQGRTFTELGFNSLNLVELQARMNNVGGLKISTTDIYVHNSPASLAGYISSKLADRPGSAADGPEEGKMGNAESCGTVASIAQELFKLGKHGEFFELLRLMSATRDTYDDSPAKLMQLTRGNGELELVCIPAFTPGSGPQEYARLAAHLPDYSVSVAAVPGHEEGDPVPASLDAIVTGLACTVQSAMRGKRFLLVGRSGGGWIAHAVAAHLERSGASPHGLILLDSPENFRSDPRWQAAMAAGIMLRIGRSEIPPPEESYTAMGAYLKIFEGWNPPETMIPTLLVRASSVNSEAFATGILSSHTDNGWWRAEWPLPHDSSDIQGDHFTILEDHAANAAEAIIEWISGKF